MNFSLCSYFSVSTCADLSNQAFSAVLCCLLHLLVINHNYKKTVMNLGSASVSSSPPIRLRQQQKHLQPATKASKLHFPKSNVDAWSKHVQSFTLCKSHKFKVCCSQVKTEESTSEDETCELVNGTELTIKGDERESIQAYLCTAVKNNNATGILLLSDIFGFEDSSTRDFAYRIACNGYNVLVPDLFNGDPWTKNRPKASYEQWITKQNTKHIARTIFTSAKWFINEFAAFGISNKLGIIGFCFGGGRVIDILAQDHEAYFGSGVSFYGTMIDSSAASNIKVPLLLITGENDALCPANVLEEMSERNKELKMVVFKERGHGFAHRPQTPEEDADAEEAFKMMRSWLCDGLLVNSSAV